MPYSSNDRSERILQGRRFTTNDLSLTQEAYTRVMDLGISEIYSETAYIPSRSADLPFSGSSQDGLIVSASRISPSISPDLPILKYWWRHKMKQTSLGNQSVYYFTTSEPASPSSLISSDQIVQSDQQTNFISPKYITPSDSSNNTEATSPGYKIVVYQSTNISPASVGSPISDANYVFDYKTGVLSFSASVLPASNQYVYVTAYQYIGKTLADTVSSTTIFPFSGSAVITGSLLVSGSGITGSLQGTASWSNNAITASYVANDIITASVSLNTITFTKGNGTTFPITVNTGSAITDYVTTSSFNAFTSSVVSTSSFNNYTSSVATTGSNNFRGNQTITGSVLISGSSVNLTVSGSIISIGGFTGSLQGTSSWASNAITASYITSSFFTGNNAALSSSYAATASLAPGYLPLIGGTITGNVTVQGTASIAFLNVTYESASVIYSSGSNQFGDAPDDVQTLYGLVRLITGSLSITGSTNVSGSINALSVVSSFTGSLSGSLIGTSSWANNYTESDPVYVAERGKYLTTGSIITSQSITGSLTISSSLNTIGTNTTTGSLRITGSSNIIGTETITGSLIVSQSVNVIGTQNITGSLITSGSNNTIGTALVTGSLIISQSTNLIGTTNVTGSLIVSSSANVIGTSLVTGSLIVSQSSNIIGTSIVTGSLIVSQSFIAIGTNIISGSLIASSSQQFIGTTIQTGSLTASGSQQFIGLHVITGSLIASSSQQLIGLTTITGSLIVSSSQQFIGSTVITGSLIASSSQQFIGSTQITGSLLITGSGIIITGSVNMTQGSYNVNGVNVLDTALAYAIALG